MPQFDWPQLFRQMMAWWWAIALAMLALMFGGNFQQRFTAPVLEPLPGLNAKIDATSVSGISSGAYMAGQFQMAHAKLVTGAAIIAGGPYGCSESVFADSMPGPGTEFLNLSKAMNGCMLDNLGVWGVADPDTLADKAKARAAKGEIDPIADVLKDRVYLFSGTSDHTVMPSIVIRAAAFYEKLGIPDAHIKMVNTLPAGHAFVTEAEGESCERSGEPYVVHCDYDQAGELLKHIYGVLNPHSTALSGNFTEFDQRPFHNGQMPDGMADSGVVYVPQTCKTEGGCRIHIAFHGCAQNREKVGDAFIKESGFARWADTNKLIVLFPQVATTMSNPQGCWDWWGYTGHDYLTREAPQIKSVLHMLEALQQGPAS
jgi:hypothetical protein